MRPFTVFTAFCVEEGDKFSDLNFGSSIMRFVTASILDEKKKKSFSLRELSMLGPATKKETFIHQKFQTMLELKSTDDLVNIVGNIELERILYDIAERITPRLTELNAKVVKKFIKSNK